MPETSSIDSAGALLDAIADPAPVLPSERLTRLAELAATALERAETSSPVLLSDQAIADVLAAVDASTAPNTKAAYRSDWGRFTAWTTQRRFPPLPAPGLARSVPAGEGAVQGLGDADYRRNHDRERRGDDHHPDRHLDGACRS